MDVHGNIDLKDNRIKDCPDTPQTGTIFQWTYGVSPPEGYLVCNGGAISRTTYSELFSVIGTRHGAGDGSTTFNLPPSKGNLFDPLGTAFESVTTNLGTGVYFDLTFAPNGDLYVIHAETNIANAYIYVRRNGESNFQLADTNMRHWYGISAHPNGNVYATVFGTGGDIYKQTAGAGNFVAEGFVTTRWRGIGCARNGDVYVVQLGTGGGAVGDIFFQSGGSGSFTALSQTSRNWVAVGDAPNGDIYAAETGGDVYIRHSGIGDFLPLGQTPRNWRGLSSSADGSVFASTVGSGVGLCVREQGLGDFISFSNRDGLGLSIDSRGDLFLSGNDYLFRFSRPSIYIIKYQ